MPDVPAQPPVAAVRPHVREHHGRVLVDDFEWLRDKEDPEVIAHLEAENAWTEQQTEHLAGLREEVFEDIRSRTLQTDLTVPSLVRHRSGDRVTAWWYYARTVEGQEYGIQCRLAAGDGSTPPDLSTAGPDGLPGEQVLLDGNVEAGEE